MNAETATSETENSSETETVEIPRDELDRIQTELSECRAENERTNRELAAERARTSELEEKVERLEAGTRADDSDDSSDESGSLTPLSRIMRLGESSVVENVTARVRRAKAIAEHFDQWSKKTPNGLVITDGLRNLLSTATGERLEWSQVNRACDALQEFTKGTIVRKKTRRKGWILVAKPDDHRLRPLLSAGG